ncbi:phosphoserine phosphatase SerB [Psychrosphaera aestuarii]|uniref:phosphoserine phosphatase SerB n=1 Tax=Psychrosphaera aestuarii TaxID=1266052 RepID=UPI001FD304CA|nr:phosphoserine phosphatase SerB [Psychrosphaera aestuarii]
MVANQNLTYSHLFSVHDCTLSDIFVELKTTDYCSLFLIKDNADSLQYLKLEGLSSAKNQDLVNSTDKIKIVAFASNENSVDSHLSSNVATASNNTSTFSWQALERIVKAIDTQFDNVLARLIKPTEDLPGAIEFIVGESEDTQLSLAKCNVLKMRLADVAEEFALQIVMMSGEKDPTAPCPSLVSPGLLVMDMDSTAISIECIDEIAKLAGVGEQVASVTASAMRGELDFAESLYARVATLTGASDSIIDQVANNLPLMPGLTALVSVLQKHGWKIAIVSGGFTAMTEALKQQLNLDRTIANNLDVKNGILTGKVSGKVIDAQAKAEAVVELAKEFDIPMQQTIAMGDGANDLLMMAVANLGVAFHAKPKVREQADVSVSRGGLDQLLYLIS